MAEQEKIPDDYVITNAYKAYGTVKIMQPQVSHCIKNVYQKPSYGISFWKICR